MTLASLLSFLLGMALGFSGVIALYYLVKFYDDLIDYFYKD